MTGKEFLHWAYPQIGWLGLILLLGLWPALRAARTRRPSLDWPSMALLKGLPSVTPRSESHRPWTWLVAAALLAMTALARPQMGLETRVQTAQGIDIVLCLDTSTSMEAMDLLPNRLTAAINVSKKFVEARANDRIGLVCFGGQAITQCPLTGDHQTLISYLDQIQPGQTGLDGTAIGTGIATSVNRLKKARGTSKVIILLTDGRNNAGEIDPLAAADLAKKMGVRIYAIGAATHGLAPVPVRDPLGFHRQQMVRVDLDEDSLREIARRTGGQSFRATDSDSLDEIFQQIDRLEKNDAPSQSQVEYRELFDWPLLCAILCLILFLWEEHGPRRERP
ncbi:VWA domain-containing protein [bacterium]|nr:VWA domain-containing protein [bacterium]